MEFRFKPLHKPVVKAKPQPQQRKPAAKDLLGAPKSIEELKGIGKTMTDYRQHILVDYLGGMTPSQIAAKYNQVIAKPASVHVYANQMGKWGYPALKKQFASRKEMLARDEKALAEKLAKKLAEKSRQHIETMVKFVDKGKTVIDNLEFKTAKELGAYLGIVNDYDELARKTFGMDKNDKVQGNQMQVAFLIGAKLEPVESPHVVEAELMQESSSQIQGTQESLDFSLEGLDTLSEETEDTIA